MIVRVSNADIWLEEPDDFDRFSVEITSSTPDPAGVIQEAAAGELVGSDAWVATAWIRANSSGSALGDWDAQFGAMLGYAKSHGWISEDGRSIKAHVLIAP